MASTNQNITLKGNKVKVAGHEIRTGDSVPDFVVTGTDLADVTLNSFKGKVVVLLSIPSLDTPVCAAETKRFNQEVAKLDASKVAVLVISRDTPFAQKRWCGAEGVDKVSCASDFKHRTFGTAFGVDLPDVGILARAVFVVDQSGKIQHVDYVGEVANEPDYDAAIAKIKELTK